MFDLNGCDLRYDAHWARTARSAARRRSHEDIRRGGTARGRVAAALVALAARLDATALQARQAATPVAPTPPAG